MLDRDLAIERGRPEDDSALDLRLYRIGIGAVPQSTAQPRGERGRCPRSRPQLQRPAPYRSRRPTGGRLPRPALSGNGRPQPAFRAGSSRTALARGFPPRRTRLYATASCLAMSAKSLMKPSLTKTRPRCAYKLMREPTREQYFQMGKSPARRPDRSRLLSSPDRDRPLKAVGTTERAPKSRKVIIPGPRAFPCHPRPRRGPRPNTDDTCRVDLLLTRPDNFHVRPPPGDLDGPDGAVGLQPPAKPAAQTR